MPNVEANNTNYNSDKEGNVCAVDKLNVSQNKQAKNNNEEFASEVHLDQNLENYESKNTFGNQNNERKGLPVSERTAWN
ncbi:hypothetical protein [Ureibacillus chungkukjangi]|uniref:Uncharacterized protein n=1 Tax=Ureibacillus chungkukjangi TaxID=1202712 RepID=A0A318TVU9_9BACL|nr:hypothetical protein [Ureibacillus chungkukjangi]PYF08503.1 hypothetical protein BJ095_102269 [Ureibacillus chungkukjangi]